MPVVLHALAARHRYPAGAGRPAGSERRPRRSCIRTLPRWPMPWRRTPGRSRSRAGRRSSRPRRMPLTDSCGFPLLPTTLAIKAEDYPLALPVLLVGPEAPPAASDARISRFPAHARRARGRHRRRVHRPVRHAPADDGGRVAADQRDPGRGRGHHAGRPETAGRDHGRGGSGVAYLPVRGWVVHAGRPVAGQPGGPRATDRGGAVPQSEDWCWPGSRTAREPPRRTWRCRWNARRRWRRNWRRWPRTCRPAQMPVVEGFGEALPMACDETAIGRQLNRRVELWVVPDFAPPGTPPILAPAP